MRETLQGWVLDGVKANGGSANIVQVARHIWENHRDDLEHAGDFFFTWQYEMRWAAQRLRDQGKLSLGRGRTWTLPGRS
jgi:hypothetical protein